MWRRWWNVVAVLVVAVACAGAADAANTTFYPAPRGAPVSAALASTLPTVLQPDGVPVWATPPVAEAGARIATTSQRMSAIVVPYRSGAGWCLAYAREQRAGLGWCTALSGSTHAVEGGLVFFAPIRVGLLARASSAVVRLVVTLADGRRVPVALEHGVALSPLVDRTRAGDRPVSVAAIGRRGNVVERRGLGWSAARWREFARPLSPPKPLTKAHLEQLSHTPTCVGARTPSGHSVTFTVVWGVDRDAAVTGDFVPPLLGPSVGRLYVTARKHLHVSLIDGDGTHRPLPLGAAHCAYVRLTARDRQGPFKLEARDASGRLVATTRPNDWPEFPTDNP